MPVNEHPVRLLPDSATTEQVISTWQAMLIGLLILYVGAAILLALLFFVLKLPSNADAALIGLLNFISGALVTGFGGLIVAITNTRREKDDNGTS